MESGKNKSIIVMNPSHSQLKDTGMAFALLCLIICLLTGSRIWLVAGTVIILLDMIYSKMFFIPAILWFTLANILGWISSKVLLTLIFFIIITPIGLIRKLFRLIGFGKKSGAYDSLKLYRWKKSNESVFKLRNYKFGAKDLMKPY